MFRQCIMLTLALYWGTLLHGQQGYSCKLLSGFLMSHHPEMQNMEAHVKGVEFNKFWTIKHPAKPFDQMQAGIGGFYMYLGKPNINGSVWAILPYVETNLTRSAKHPLFMKWAAGMGYITRPFQFPSNIRNKAIGTHINGCMQMQLAKHFTLSRSIKLIGGFGLTHFSNGNFKKPNLGINMPHLNLGLSYSPTHMTSMQKEAKINATNLTPRLAIVLGYSSRQIAIDDPKRVQIASLGADYRIPLKRKKGHYVRLGTDLFWDPSYTYVKFTDSSTTSLPEVVEHGLRLGYEWQVNKVSLTADWGIYTYRPQKLKRLHYITIGLDYDITDPISVFVKLKTHLAVADYFMWGLSVNIWRNKR